jgi:hypothetical protein
VSVILQGARSREAEAVGAAGDEDAADAQPDHSNLA